MARVIHTGDTHIGYRQYHSATRRRDFLDAFDHVIDDAIDADVDAVVHAGDLFHDTSPAIPELMATVEVLKRLKAADIPFLGVVGNHEATHDQQWLDLFTDLDLATRLDDAGVTIAETTFYGLDYVPPSRREELEYDFAACDTDHAVLVAHGLFEPFAHADWDTETLLEIAAVDFDALLLGDNHTPGQAEIANTWVTYCGSTERTSAAEREERGYNLVTFDNEVRITRRRVERARPWRFVDVDLAGGEGTDRIIDRAREFDLDDAVVIVRVTGDGTDIAPATIEEALAAAGALIVRVIDDRELPESDTPTVTFADPDRAVDERLRAVSLSGAGELVDSVVRDESLVDAVVRERVKTRVETLLAEAPDAFERQPATHAESSEPADERPPEPDVEVPNRTDEDTNGEDQASIAEFG